MEWRTLVLDGVITNYEISPNGIIRNKKNKHELSIRLDKDGYLITLISINGVPKTVKLHRLVALTYLPNPGNLPVVHHIDHNRQNPNIDNLEWVSTEFNSIEAHENGFHNYVNGIDHGMNKYTEKQIRSVCKYLESGELTYNEIAVLTNIPVATIKAIFFGKQWNHISKEYEFKPILSHKNSHKELFETVDKMICFGYTRSKVMDVLTNGYNLTKKQAENLYYNRKRAFKYLEFVLM